MPDMDYKKKNGADKIRKGVFEAGGGDSELSNIILKGGGSDRPGQKIMYRLSKAARTKQTHAQLHLRKINDLKSEQTDEPADAAVELRLDSGSKAHWSDSKGLRSNIAI